MSDKTKNTPKPTDEKTPEPTSVPVEDKKPDQTPNKDNQQPEKTYSEAELEAKRKKWEKEWQKKVDDEAAKAKLGEDERLKVELEEARRENQMLKAESEVVKALTDAGAKNAKLLFDAKQSALEFKDGKLTNLKELVDDLKLSYPDQFGTDKPKDTIDGGAGNKETPQGRAETLGDALKNYYSNKKK